jgi:hypothetical protein
MLTVAAMKAARMTTRGNITVPSSLDLSGLIPAIAKGDSPGIGPATPPSPLERPGQTLTALTTIGGKTPVLGARAPCPLRLEPRREGEAVSSFMNIRVANIAECHERWKRLGAELLTGPKV